METKRFSLLCLTPIFANRYLFPNYESSKELDEFREMNTWLSRGRIPVSMIQYAYVVKKLLLEIFPEFSKITGIANEIFGNRDRTTVYDHLTRELLIRLRKEGFKDYYDLPQLPEGIEVDEDDIDIIGKLKNLARQAGIIIEAIPINIKHVHDYTSQSCVQTKMASSSNQKEWDENMKFIMEKNEGKLPERWYEWIFKSGLADDVRSEWDDIEIKLDK